MSDDRALTPEETARVVELALHFAREGMTEELARFVDRGADDAVVRVLVEAGADLDAGTPSARATAEMFQRPLP